MSPLLLLLTLAASTREVPCTYHPGDGGLYHFGGSLSGTLTGCSIGSGWQFRDGGAVEVATDGTTYCWPLYETEVYRSSIIVGTRLGTRQEYYFGHGLVAVLDLGTGTSIAAVVWHPNEFVSFTFGLDPLRGRLGWSWRQFS